MSAWINPALGMDPDEMESLDAAACNSKYSHVTFDDVFKRMSPGTDRAKAEAFWNASCAYYLGNQSDEHAEP